jgi:uncharacterized protein (DUF924 family)
MADQIAGALPADWQDKVIGFWFGELTAKDWFGGARPDIDSAISGRFGALHATLSAGAPDAATGKDALAAIIVLDQFPRNMFRDSPQAFATDAMALAISEAAIAAGLDHGMRQAERQFLYMPYMHSEDLAVQVRSIELFDSLGDPSVLDYARRHKDVIARFDRFPHRNAILCRASTADEETYLAEPGSGF